MDEQYKFGTPPNLIMQRTIPIFWIYLYKVAITFEADNHIHWLFRDIHKLVLKNTFFIC